jgi:hypothetical protein
MNCQRVMQKKAIGNLLFLLKSPFCLQPPGTKTSDIDGKHVTGQSSWPSSPAPRGMLRCLRRGGMTCDLSENGRNGRHSTIPVESIQRWPREIGLPLGTRMEEHTYKPVGVRRGHWDQVAANASTHVTTNFCIKCTTCTTCSP